MRDCESARFSFIFAWYEVFRVCVDVVRGRRL